MKKSSINFIGLILLLIKVINISFAADVTVSGKVYQQINTPGAGEPEYIPLPDVKIGAYRDSGGSIFPSSKESDSQGKFELVIPSGDYFTIVFYSATKMPQLQQLAAIPNYKHDVAIVLEKMDDVIKKVNTDSKSYPREKFQYVVSLIRHIESSVPKGSDEFINNVREALDKAVNQIKPDNRDCLKPSDSAPTPPILEIEKMEAPTLSNPSGLSIHQ